LYLSQLLFLLALSPYYFGGCALQLATLFLSSSFAFLRSKISTCLPFFQSQFKFPLLGSEPCKIAVRGFCMVLNHRGTMLLLIFNGE
jgi:hypothetical protein